MRIGNWRVLATAAHYRIDRRQLPDIPRGEQGWIGTYQPLIGDVRPANNNLRAAACRES
jgi:hypothetical protein